MSLDFCAVLTIGAAYVGTGYQHGWQVLIGMGAAFAYLQMLMEPHRKSAEKHNKGLASNFSATR